MRVSQAEVKKLFRYDPETGEFWRRKKTKGCRFDRPVGNISTNGYQRIWVGGKSGKNYQSHQLVWLYMTGQWPVLDIDHKNGDRLDNRFENLREITRSSNLQNSLVCKKGSLIKYRGVTKNKKRFASGITADKVRYHLGTFDTAEEAYQVYLDAKKILHVGWVW